MIESMYAAKKKPGGPNGSPGAGGSLKKYLANPTGLNGPGLLRSLDPAGPAPPAVPTSIANTSPATSPTAAANVDKAAAQAAGGGVGPGMSHDVSFNTDYSSDPVLQKMLMGGAADEAGADAAALGQRRGVVAQLGDRGLASSVLGAGDPTLDSISDDPDKSTSTLARLKRAYGSTVKQNEDSINENNLWYGGKHGEILGNLSKDYQTQVGDASSQAQSALDQIAAGLASTKKGIRDQRASAEGDAASRKAQQLLAEILAGGGAGGNGGNVDPGSVVQPGGTDPGAAAADTGAAGTGQYWDPVKQVWVNSIQRNQGYGLLQ